MKVINLCTDDWANYSHENARSLRSVGIDCEDYKRNAHIHHFTEQSKIITASEMKDIVSKLGAADVVQIFFDDLAVFRHILPAVGNTRLIVVHAGTTYRENPEHFNAAFNPHVWKSVIALGEFEHSGAKDPVYVIGGVDTEKLQPSYISLNSEDPVVIGHFPSKDYVKGSALINSVIRKLNDQCAGEFTYIHDAQTISHEDNLKRMQGCDIYIEALSLTNVGKPYGSWGITCMEAAALGKAVITHHLWGDLYGREYGEFGCIVANHEFELYRRLHQLINLERIDLVEVQERCRKWAEDKHSLQSIGLRYKQKVLAL